MKPQKSLYTRALDILARRETSRAELKRKLAPYAESEAELETLLNGLVESRLQSDDRFAESYIHSASRRHGRLRLQQALQAKGVSEDTARSFLPDRNSEIQTAVAVLRKKFKAPAADLKEKQKQARFLAYRGFDTDTIQTALKNGWNGGEEWE
ncbi:MULTISPECIES: recombination regulator RecX [Neisseria]|uniref:Regulatory protein RecX n=1 Tax=Neisseria musculi TaxID=1815583 RepID=A0A7H1M9D5_9NEIS|nr:MULTISPECIES: recombination regulator RecX [Neisseria]MBF0803462.1 recombination regulator RecX [Neisseria sp. 19428wB4_WF04]QNT58250.1 recX family protein [Neisseria musculi]TFU43855.1 recombination regulator RecX [Neisseria sp. WF04]